MKRDLNTLNYLTKKEAAAFIGCSISFVDGMCQKPGFPIYRIGRRVLIDKAKLIQWIEKQQVEAN